MNSGPTRLHLPVSNLNSTQVPSTPSQSNGSGVGVLVSVAVGGTGVAVAVGGTGVAVAVGGTDVDVAVGGIWVLVHLGLNRPSI